jgi:hypothetical protein
MQTKTLVCAVTLLKISAKITATMKTQKIGASFLIALAYPEKPIFKIQIQNLLLIFENQQKF